MDRDLDYVTHLARESARFAEACLAAAPSAQVPTCPDWTTDDLLWHLARVQLWWATILREHLSGPEAQHLMPERPASRDAMHEEFQRASAELVTALTGVAPDTPAWTWSDDHTVGFIRRMQAVEALVHRVDAEVTAGERTALDPALSADGVDLVLRVIYSGVPDWGAFMPDARKTLRLWASDTGDSWLLTLGRFTGTDPDGTTYDEPDFSVAGHDHAGGPAAALVQGTAADLLCRLWHRPPTGQVARSGSTDILGEFDVAISQGIN